MSILIHTLLLSFVVTGVLSEVAPAQQDAEGVASSVLAGDDACLADGTDPACSLNALQMHGAMKQSAGSAAAAKEVQQQAQESSSAATPPDATHAEANLPEDLTLRQIANKSNGTGADNASAQGDEGWPFFGGHGGPFGRNPAACSSHPRCNAQGLLGECCPDRHGNFLACCKPRQCQAYLTCQEQGLVGMCCPDRSGNYLGCCSSMCVDYPACKAQGLVGQCCPDNNGNYLGCCSPKCRNYPRCEAQGLRGDCCPTTDGTFLSCCAR